MSSPLTHLFSDEELATLSQLPEVVAARARVAGSRVVYFTIPLTDSIRQVLEERLGLSLATVSQIPMRWIQGDTAPHIDTGAHVFERTYLVYLNDSPGEFILGSDAYPIRANTAFVFSEGLRHSTLHTGSEPRLLIGPMNELAEPVGGSIVCFLEGSRVLCLKDGKEVYQAIESLTVGTLVKTRLSGYKKIEIIKSGPIKNPGSAERIAERLYKCSTTAYPELKEDLYLTGHHSILVDSITETQNQGISKHLGRIFVTDRKYRLIACVDERAEPWASEGTYTIWHIALENIDPNMNYGIYVNGGLLVETCCINTLKNSTTMKAL
jgi:hypothetical protein